MQADNIPCGAGFRFDDAFAEGDGIFADSDEVIAAYRVFPPQGGAPDDRRNALGIIGAVDVQVSGKRHQYVARFEDVRHFVPVAQVLVQREVVDEDNRLLPGVARTMESSQSISSRGMWGGPIRRLGPAPQPMKRTPCQS